MTDVATTVVEQSVKIDATPEVVWQYWVDPALLARWWGESKRLDARAGGPYDVAAGPGHVAAGEFVELVPHERLVFTFGWEGNAPDTPLAPGSTTVEVSFQPEGDGTLVVLRHHDMPATHAPDHSAGWAHFLGILAEKAAAPT